MKTTLTYDTAMAAAKDAATRNMQQAGRDSWDEEDWNVAAETLGKLWPSARPTDQLNSQQP